MSQLPAPVRAVADQLERSAGSYLKSIVREQGLTCDVCCTPVSAGHRRCIPCTSHAGTGRSLADRVGSLVYAVKPDSQTYLLLYNYKTPAAGPSHEGQMKALLALGLRGHARCAQNLAGSARSAWCLVPSTRGRPKLHNLVSQLATSGSREITVSYADAGRKDRGLHPELWSVALGDPPPEHVLVVDDSWVTGSHAQGVASALKAAGVGQVSVFTVANVLDLDWSPNVPFVEQRLTRSGFDKEQCPWTGAACPDVP